MKNAVTLALAAALSTASLGGVAFAQTAATTATTAESADMVRIVLIDENSDSDDATTQVPEMYQNPTAEMTAEARAEAQADAAIMTALQEANVDVDKIQAIETAANGGKIIYVK
jgi:Na+-translocating ferredoxin:NAD+ oxidoreductase RnfG subunit